MFVRFGVGLSTFQTTMLKFSQVIYIYICVCVCVCNNKQISFKAENQINSQWKKSYASTFCYNKEL